MCSTKTICTTATTTTTAMIPYSKEQQCLIAVRKMIEESGDELLVKNTWDFTDDFLLRYIRSRGYNADSAFERLQNHMYVRRVKNPEIFARLYPSAVPDALERGGGGVFKNRDHKGRHILYYRIGHWDPDDVNVDDMLLSLMMLGWEMLSFKETQLNGMVIVVDATGFSVKHAKCGTPVNIQKYTDLILRASPFKCKGAHVLNAPMLFNVSLSMVKVFLPHKLRKRIHVHGTSTKDLHKYISPEILPDWLGGHLTHEEAIDHDIVGELYTPEKDEYYKSFVN